MDTRTSGSDLWATASADAEGEIIESLFTAVRVEASEFWPILAGADSTQDFEVRLDVIASKLDAVTAGVLTDDTESYYPELRNRLTAAFEQDFNLIQERRVEATRRRHASLQREVIAEIRKQAEDGGATTADPKFLEGPAEGQTGPASTGGTPGSDAPDNASGDGPTRDNAEGPNILPEEDVANSVTGSFQTAAGLTRKDFQAIAAIIKSQPDTVRADLANQFAAWCAGTNPNFDRGRFISACGSRLDFSKSARKAEVTGARDVAEVQAYMPSNYTAYEKDGKIYVEGDDSAGWTLDDYVIPRLGSGMMGCKEVFDEPHTQSEGQNVYYTAGFDKDQDDRDAGRPTDAEMDGKGDDTDNDDTDYFEKDSARRTAGFGNPRPSWDSVMKDPLLDAVWPRMRQLADEYIIADRGPDSMDGISSSDVNHTIFGVAEMFQKPEGGTDWPAVANYMADFADDRRPVFGGKTAVNEDSWDTGEVALQFANNYDLYIAGQSATSAHDVERLWNQHNPNPGVNTGHVNWDTVWEDVQETNEEANG